MASKNKSVTTEIGIEGCLVLAAFLVDRAREWGDVKPNVFWEYGCYAVIVLLLLRIFWILPWTSKWNTGIRLGVVILVPLFLIVANWQSARDKHLGQHSPPPKPEYKVTLKVGDTTLELTNSFLKFKTLPEKASDILGYLVIPIKSTKSIPSLELLLGNDSPVYSEEVLVSCWWDRSVSISPGAWAYFDRKDTNIVSMAHRTEPIFPRNGYFLPALQINDCLAISNTISAKFAIQIMPKDRNDSFYLMWLYMPFDNVACQITKAETNGVFFMRRAQP